MILDGEKCSEAKGYKALIFFLALYLVALGSGCLKPNIISHAADQFKKEDSKQSKKLSSYFNAAYFAFCMGELVALTVLVWVQTHSGMDVGFGVSAAAMAMGLISLISGTLVYMNKSPRGSIFTPIAQVICAPTLSPFFLISLLFLWAILSISYVPKIKILDISIRSFLGVDSYIILNGILRAGFSFFS